MRSYDRDDTIVTVFGIVGVLSVIAIAIFLITYRSEANGTVESFSWMRAINIMRYQTVEESDWQVPTGGREIRRYSAFHHDEKYISGYNTETKCDSNGVCKTTSEAIYSYRAIYETKYDYQIEKWIVNRVSKLSADDHTPIWPDVSDIRGQHNPPQIGDERTGTSTSKYTIVVKTDDKTYKLDIPEELWLSFETEEKCTVVITILGRADNIKKR